MRSRVYTRNFTEKNNKPAGGFVSGSGISIVWRNDPLGRDDDHKAPNDASVEDVIAAAMQRIEFLEDSPYACESNRAAIRHLGLALEALDSRTKDREAREVEGLHEA